MTSRSSPPNPGGFFHSTLPSPPQSAVTSPRSVSSTFPKPRSHPLKPGSARESSFINYVDRRLLDISRRYEKRFNLDMQDQSAHEVEGHGYEAFSEVAKDLEKTLDIVWVSGTPSLQTPYVLTIALTTSTYLTSFSFAPRQTFQLLKKLDLAFCSLIRGHDVETGDALPGFEGGRGRLSTTEKVRIKGLVERTRVSVVEIAGKDGSIDAASGTMATMTDTEKDLVTDNDDAVKDREDDLGHGIWEMELARVYERTLVELGESLGFSSHIGDG